MLCLFEDRAVDNFYPLVLTRHLADLLVGSRTLRERAVAAFGEGKSLLLHGRGYIREHCRGRGFAVDPFAEGDRAIPSQSILCVNARLPVDHSFAESLPGGERWKLTDGENVLAARLTPDDVRVLDWNADALDFDSLDLPTVETSPTTDAKLYGYLWDLIADNPSRIAADFPLYAPTPGFAAPGAHLVAPERIAVHADVVLKPGVVIDASGGPVIIGPGTTVMANSVIEGPCYIGPNCTIKIGAKIYEGSSFGARCKIGGEVENSIVIGYANKQHDGFLGHSYLGAWVNLGADTNTSDLKNNYGSVRVLLNGREVNSGRMLLGSLIGDHSKTGINTMLNTGTVIGVSANIFGGGFPPREIPSFAWGGSGGFEPFRPEKAIELARTVTARRGIDFTDADKRLLMQVWEGGQKRVGV